MNGKMKKIGTVATLLPMVAMAEMVSAPDALKTIGFKDTSYLYNQAATVVDSLTGDYNLQVNDVVSGGKTVTLGSTDNSFTGGTYVKSGTLVVPGIGALGNTDLPIVLGNSRIRFTADVTTARDITVLPPDSSVQANPATLHVDENVTVKTTGRIRRLNSYSSSLTAYNNMVKRGPGTFILANESGDNQIGYSSGTTHAVSNPRFLNAMEGIDDATGEIGTGNQWAFGIYDGRFVIDTPDSVKTAFPRAFAGGCTTLTGSETAGHLEVRGGTVTGADFYVGLLNGTRTSAPEGLASSVTVSGGSLAFNTLFVGHCGTFTGSSTPISDCTNSTMRPVVNVSGGRLTAKTNVSFGTPVTARFNISGGEFVTPSVFCGQKGYRGQNISFVLSGSGNLTVSDTFALRSNSESNHALLTNNSEVEVHLNDNSLFAVRRIADLTGQYSTWFRLYGNGGTLRLTQASAEDEGLEIYGGSTTGRVRVRNGGLTIDLSQVAANGPKWRIPFVAHGASDDNWVTVTGAGKGFCLYSDKADCTSRGFQTTESTIHLGGRDTYSTAFKLDGDGAVSARGWFDTTAHTVTVNALECGASGTLEVGLADNANRTASLIVAKTFVPPTGALKVRTYAMQAGKVATLEDAPFGTYEILRFPRTVDLNPSICRYAGSVTRRSASFAVEDDGVAWKTLKMNIRKPGLLVVFK